MISAIHASMLALLLCWLALNVIKVRRKYHIALGDGDNVALQIARTAHSNASEYIPIALLLLFILEYNGGNYLIVHVLGGILTVGRILHARGILLSQLQLRILGMQMTLLTIVGMAFANLCYVFIKLFG